MNATPRQEPSSDFVFIRRAITLAALAVLGAALWALSDLILLMFGSILFAMTLWGVAGPLIRLGVGETLALVIAGFAMLAAVAGAIVFFGAEIAQQFDGLSRSLTATVDALRQQVESGGMGEWLKGMNPSAGLQGLATRLLSWGSSAAGGVVGLVLVVVGGLYIAADPRSYHDGFIKLVPPPYQDNVRATLRDCGKALHRWLGGQLVAMVMVGSLTGLGLWIAGVQSALALGLLAGLFNFVPYIGSVTAAIITLMIAAGQSLEAVLWAGLVMAIVQQIESNVITPLVVGGAVSISPAIGLYAVVALGILFGPLGLLFGFPLAIVGDIAVRRLYVRDALDQPVEILGEPAKPS